MHWWDTFSNKCWRSPRRSTSSLHCTRPSCRRGWARWCVSLLEVRKKKVEDINGWWIGWWGEMKTKEREKEREEEKSNLIWNENVIIIIVRLFLIIYLKCTLKLPLTPSVWHTTNRHDVVDERKKERRRKTDKKFTYVKATRSISWRSE